MCDLHISWIIDIGCFALHDCCILDHISTTYSIVLFWKAIQENVCFISFASHDRPQTIEREQVPMIYFLLMSIACLPIYAYVEPKNGLMAPFVPPPSSGALGPTVLMVVLLGVQVEQDFLHQP